MIAFFYVPMNFNALVQLAKHFVKPWPAANHGRFPADHPGFALRGCIDKMGGDIPTANVFLQSQPHYGFDVIGYVHGVSSLITEILLLGFCCLNAILTNLSGFQF
jgi:hypothetical protein